MYAGNLHYPSLQIKYFGAIWMQDRRKLFYGWGLSKNVGHHG